ncbi:MAG: S8 family serine peptidase [Burkholderiaceae bacterium]|nr:S8 family serine peptidase [Microbacteriaceae bacterium]
MAAAVSLIATGMATGGALPATAAPTLPSGGIIANKGQTDFTPGRYIVTLAGDAAATYTGGITGLAPTKPGAGDQLNSRRQSVQSYSDYLQQNQADVAASVGAIVGYSYTLALNGFTATLDAGQAAKLARNKAVVSLEKDELKHITAAEPSTDFLGLSGEYGVWAATGGVETAGEGIVLGVLDTGIAPENPSFAGDPLGDTAGDAPYYSELGVTSFAKADGGTFTGVCQTGEQFTIDDCSTKIVGARYFLDGFGADNIAGPDGGEYVSPRDGDSHGSHTGSTAVGDYRVETTVNGTSFGAISGVAPAAKIAAYKVCWTAPDSANDGCATSDMLKAIDTAVSDGVDALNFSIGGGSAQTTVSATDQAFLGAAAAGIFVAASAGNSGPDASTLDNASPWYTTVAASTIPNYEATVELGDGQKFAGASVTVDMAEGATPLSGPLVAASAVGLAGAETPELCLDGRLDPALTTGKIVVCDRGVNARVEKSAEVKRAGGIGMVLVNVTPTSTDLDDDHAVPTVHLDAPDRNAVLAYAATPDATATFLPGNLTGVEPTVPQVAGFSSRGPVLADGSDIIKPDITAPGVGILAAGANAAGGDPTWHFFSGTSMSSPHIAGLAVLYLGEHPDATPAEIKSAMMTTAYNTVDTAGNAVTDPFTQGAGHVDPTKYFSPGLLYLNGLGDWLSYIEGAGYDVIDPAVLPIDPSDLNIASIGIGSLDGTQTVTRTVTSTQAGTFTASVSGLPGITTAVAPSTLTFGAAGESQSFAVTFTRTDAPLNQFTTGALDWTSGDTVVHSPVALQPVPIVAPASASGEGVSGSVDITVTPGSTGDIPLSTTGLTAGVFQADPTGASADHSGSGVTGDSFEYIVDIPADTGYARFDLNAVDDTTDLDLTAYLVNENGEAVAGYSSATGAADERINIQDPAPGSYHLFVDVYSAPDGAAFDLTTFVLTGVGAPLGLDPSVLPGVQGVDQTFTASWTGLEPFTSYLGEIEYADTGASTLLEVVTAAADSPGAPVNVSPPTISGTPQVGKRLKASPGDWDTADLVYSYQWQSDGVDIPGATAKRYRVTRADQGTEISVAVTATAGGLPTTTATSAAVPIPFSSKTTLSVDSRFLFSWQRTTARVSVQTDSDEPPTGTVVFTVDGRARGEVPLTAADDGDVSLRLPKLPQGVHQVRAHYTSDADTTLGSTSRPDYLFVLF